MTATPPSRARVTPETVYDLSLVSDAQIAPDGQRVAYVLTTIDRQASTYRSALWIVPVEGGEPVAGASGAERDEYPRWSPDGSMLAFLSQRGGTKQLWLIPAQGGEPVALTAARNNVAEYAWAPDSRRIAFVTQTGPADAAADAVKASPEPVSDERVITRLEFRRDGVGFLEERHQHIWILSVSWREASGPVAGRQVTDGPWDDYSPSWSPDGREIAFVSTRPNVEEPQRFYDVYVVPAEAGAQSLPAARKLTRSLGPVAQPAWAPDGRAIAYVGHAHPEPYGQTANTSPWVAEIGSGRLSDLGVEFDHTVNVNFSFGHDRGNAIPAGTDVGASSPQQSPIWDAESKSILVQPADRGNTHIYRIDVETGQATPVIVGERNVLNYSSSRDGTRLAFTAGDSLNPGDVFVCRADGGDERQLTRLNEAVLAKLDLSTPERFTVRRPDGFVIDGWAMRPVPFELGRRYPAVLEIHGGPHVQFGTAFSLEFQVLAASGIGVIYTNPRGSLGYGQRFVFATHQDWGGGHMRDLLACVDHVVAAEWVDDARLGVTGNSYGGFMTNWIIGQTNRFKAAVSSGSISNFVSKWGVSDNGWVTNDWQWGGPPYDDFEGYMRSSPISYVKHITTPVMFMNGEQDLRCPISEAEQLFSALKRLGREVKMVRFPGESHTYARSGKPVRRVKRLHYLRDWFLEHLEPEPVVGSASER